MDGDAVLVELIKLIPSVLWFLLAALLIFLFRRRIEEMFRHLSTFEAMGVKLVCMRDSFDAALDLAEKSPEWHVHVPPEAKRLALGRARQQHALVKAAQFLWVDDRPENNVNERRMFHQLGVDIDSVPDNARALEALTNCGYDLVISDIGRPAGEPDGLQLAKPVHDKGIAIVYYVGSFDPSLGTPPYAFAITNRPDELLHLAFDILARRRGDD